MDYHPLVFRSVEWMPDNMFVIVNEQGLVDLLKEMMIPWDQLFTSNATFDWAKLEKEIMERKLAVLCKNIG